MNTIIVPRKTLFGAGAFAQLGPAAREEGRTAFVLAYTNSGEFRSAVASNLEAAGVRAVFHDTVDGEPEAGYMDSCAAACTGAKCDLVVSIGGGSVIDTGKIAAIMASHPGPVADYQMGRKEFSLPALPHVAVPTTAGTGAEATKVAVVTNKKAGIKKSIGHPSLIPRTVILDPELTRNLPSRLTLLVGLDALSHAMESHVSPNASPFTEAYSARAVELIREYLPRCVRDGGDMAAREALLVASNLAGLALNAGVGAAHVLAQPLSAASGLSHSLAIALLLPAVVEANHLHSPAKYARIAALLGENVHGLDEKAAAARSVDGLRNLYRVLGFAETLKTHGVEAQLFPAVMESAAKSTRHISTNPRPVTDELLLDILGRSL